MRALTFCLALVCSAAEVRYLDLAPFARSSKAGSATVLEWNEERDVREVVVRYPAAPPAEVRVEYWFHTWPYPPPQMPTVEDPVDDPYQGRWVAAKTREACSGSECRYTFEPLDKSENPRADNLPGVRYRRTLKLKLPPGASPAAVYSDSTETRLTATVRFAQRATFEAYNGRVESVAPEPGGYRLEIAASLPAPPGSNDVTVISVRGERAAFSFSPQDLAGGPVSVPAYSATVTDPRYPARPKLVRRIRAIIPEEPEQTLERASREIPSLDAWKRQNGDRVYLPLAVDSSWQKFAFEYGGAVFISKRGAKAKGSELKRLKWEGDRAVWQLGVNGEFDRRTTASVLDNWLPVAQQRWQSGPVHFEEEAFATVEGPLDPASRNEQTPAVLMIRLTARNRGSAPQRFQVAQRGTLVAQTADNPVLDVPPNAARSVVFRLPFVSDAGDLAKLDYETERARVIDYWKRAVEPYARFRVPETRFNDFVKAVLAHIRISTTKDPRSALFMVPAASYNYQVYANESSFQTLLLDSLGDHATAGTYLDTFLRLQGSRNFPGLHKGMEDAIFHGARVDADYDYTASNYGLDHGTVLWAMAEHFLFSRDRAWLDRAWPHMRKAIDWIELQRSTTPNHLLPASHLEDNSDWAQWFSINAFAWAGMDRSARALAAIGHSDAAKLAAQAAAYRNDLRSAVLAAAASAPVRRVRDGSFIPYVPVQPAQRFALFGPLRREYYSRYGRPDVLPIYRLSATREVLYGPMILLSLGVFAPDEPVADWILDDWEDNLTLTSGLGLNVHGITDDRLWFSQGGMVFQSNLQNPILAYLKRHEVEAAIRNLYNSFTACLYPEVNAFTEEYRMWRNASGPFYKIPDEAKFVNRLRDMLVLEQGDELWLASGTPRRWLESRDGIQVSGIATWFGPVTYTMRAGKSKTVEATVELPARNPAKRAWLVVRTPPGQMRGVTIDGRNWSKIDAAREAIELPAGGKPIKVEVRY